MSWQPPQHYKTRPFRRRTPLPVAGKKLIRQAISLTRQDRDSGAHARLETLWELMNR